MVIHESRALLNLSKINHWNWLKDNLNVTHINHSKSSYVELFVSQMALISYDNDKHGP